jgi:hypothetical protein
MTTIPYNSDLLPEPKLRFPTLKETTAKTLFSLDDQYLPVGKGFDNVANLELNNLATAPDVKKLQDQANELANKLYKESTLKGLTLRIAVADMYEAITGIIADIYKNNGKISMKQLFTKNNRVRGLGLIFILVAISYMAFM